MPLYVYLCPTCGTKSELLRPFTARLDPAPCPECQSEARFALSLSVPSLVGAGASDCRGPDPSTGGCCGGGACAQN